MTYITPVSLDSSHILRYSLGMSHTMMYSVGHNLPGCLPNEAPALFADWTLAKSALLDDVDRLIDDDGEFHIASDNIEFALTGEHVNVYADGEHWWIDVVYLTDDELADQLELW